MLLTIPLARQVSRGLRPNYDNPYGLMAIMGVNVQLHLRAGLLLLAAYARRPDRRSRGPRRESLPARSDALRRGLEGPSV